MALQPDGRGAIETKDTSALLLNGEQNRGRPVSFHQGLMDLCTCANGTLLTFPVSPALSVCGARSVNNPVCEHSYLGDTTTIIFHLFCAHRLARAHIHQPPHSCLLYSPPVCACQRQCVLENLLPLVCVCMRLCARARVHVCAQIRKKKGR